jgi:hypothetical protein
MQLSAQIRVRSSHRGSVWLLHFAAARVGVHVSQGAKPAGRVDLDFRGTPVLPTL